MDFYDQWSISLSNKRQSYKKLNYNVSGLIYDFTGIQEMGWAIQLVINLLRKYVFRTF